MENKANTTHFHDFTPEDSRAIWAAHPDYLFCKGRGPHFQYRACNAAFAALVGLAHPSAIKGLTDFDLPWQMGGHRAPFFRAGDQDTITGRKAIVNQLEMLALPNQPIRLMQVTKKPLRNQKGQIYGVLGIARDRTTDMNTAAILENLLAQADDTDTTRRQLLARISHSLRTPLTGLMTAGELLSQQLAHTPHASHIQLIKQASQALSSAINRLITFAGETPLRQASSHSSQSVSPIPADHAPMTCRVLIVEDDAITGLVLRRLFESLGAQVTTALSAETGLTAYLNTRPDLLITDIGLPGRSGIELVSWIQKKPIPFRARLIVGLSAHLDAPLKHVCINVGMDRAFQKPLMQQQAQSLLMACQSLIDQPTQPLKTHTHKKEAIQ